MTFNIFAAAALASEPANNGNIVLAAGCAKCGRPICAYVDPTLGGQTETIANSLAGYSGDVMEFVRSIEIWPKPLSYVAPIGLSTNVERPFLQGEDNRARGNLEAAGAMYRKALDTASKELGVDLKKTRNLQHRLRLLLEADKLTPAIADWADHIRLLGNDATHEEDVPTQTEIDDLANLTRMALIYLFEMPKRIADMRAATGSAGGGAGSGG